MALTTKLLVTLVAAYLTLSLIGNATIWEVLIIAVVGTALNYLLGDLVILPVGGNITAALCDGLVAGILAFAVMMTWGAKAVNYWALLSFAILVAVAEYFFHNYLKRSEEVAP
ncbi:MAG TPA: DUF2512 family protein [Syntrophomonadaceae bacterium]|nr:DUF2512 family protein [Syntrophomonadaceae bacterium]